MKKLTTRTLKIHIDSGNLSALDLNDLEKWENEGGRSENSKNDLLNSLVPLKKGMIIEIGGGSFYYENNQLIYEMEIEVLALP